jgi:predicted RND superfamily exporter protein
MHGQVDRFLTYWSELSLRRSALLSSIVVLVMLIGVPGTVQLYGNLHTDLRELLPKGAPAAVGLDELEKRLGGLSHLTVVVRTEDFAAGAKFVDALVVKLKTLPPSMVANVDYRVDAEKEWFDKHGALYADTQDLQTTLDRLKAAHKTAVKTVNPLLVNLDDDEKPAASDTAPADEHAAQDEKLRDPELRRGLDKLKSAYAALDRFPGGYLAGENNSTFVIMMTPPNAAVALADNLRMTHAVEDAVAEVNPAQYSKTIVVGYGGEVRSVIEAQEALVRDLAVSSVLVLLLVALALFIYYRTLRALLVLALPLFAGVMTTFAIARVLIHYLNPNTAFLGSIIIGNGINPGIILLARIFEEQRHKKPISEALRIAMTSTWPATLAASSAAAVSYGTLIFVRFRGFNQFGQMGLIGMLLCWLVTYLGMPPVVALLEKWKPLPIEGKDAQPAVGKAGRLYARVVTHSGNAPVILSGLLVVIALIGIYRFARDPILYDFTKLGSRLSVKQGASSWDQHVDAVLQSYQTPTVVLTNSPAEARTVASSLKKEKVDRGPSSTIDSVQTLDQLLPLEQPEKLAVLHQLFEELTPSVVEHLPLDIRPLIIRLHDKTELRTVALNEIPERMQRFFHEKDGTAGKLVMVYPTLASDSHHGRAQVEHAREVRDAARIAVPGVHVAGQIVLAADIVKIISTDGRLAGLASFLGVALLALIAMRSFRQAIWVIGPLCLGVLWMFGALGLFNLQFNFVNFSVLPITFGIGVDYAVNLYERARHSPSIEAGLAASGGAVALCSATTVIGYAVLLVADNQAIQSFGLTAVIGELTCLTAALFALPAVLALLERRKTRTTLVHDNPPAGA